MMNLKQWVQLLIKCGCFLLAIYFLGWGFTIYKAVFMGLILGTFVSIVNALFTAYKVDQFGKRVAAGLKPGGMGMLSRMSMAIIVVMLAIRFPDVLHIGGAIAGLMTVPLIFYITGLWQAIRNSRA